MNYGLPYMGSKSGIAELILNKLPPAKNFYDLFGGGGAIAHCASERFKSKWQTFHYNEIKPGMVEFIQDCIAGKYNYKVFKPPFITREEFFKRKDQYCKVVWSFGNNGKQYMFNPQTEILKKSLHNAVVFNEFDEFAKKFTGIDKFHTEDIKKRRLSLKRSNKDTNLQQLQQLERLQQLEQLERLQQLERLERLEGVSGLTFSSISYEKILIKPDSIVYCDPPYAETTKYDGDFDHKIFYNWALKNDNPIFISEYQMPKDFRLIACISKRSTLSSTANNLKYEKLFSNNAGFDLLKKSNK